MSLETQEYVLRIYGDGSYGVGQIVVDNVALFSDGNYNLNRQEAEEKLNKLRGKR